MSAIHQSRSLKMNVRSIRSCPHYINRVQCIMPCCGLVYPCRRCHDEDQGHEVDRRTITSLCCKYCGQLQRVQKSCERCFVVFGNYACLICRLFDDEDKGQFHCDACGICRLGGRENYYHCPKCDMCLNINIKDTHKCIEKLSYSDCPICLEFLHTSTFPCTILNCGHMIHEKCHKECKNYSIHNCPLCLNLEPSFK